MILVFVAIAKRDFAAIPSIILMYEGNSLSLLNKSTLTNILPNDGES